MEEQMMIKFSRDDYRAVKSMDRQQMTAYINNVYKQGYNKGVDTAVPISYQKGVDDTTEKLGSGAGVNLNDFMSKIKTAVDNTKGIGEKRSAELLDNIERELSNNSGGEYMVGQYQGYNIYQVDEHVEVHTADGEFVVSADTEEEAHQMIDQVIQEMNTYTASQFDETGEPIN